MRQFAARMHGLNLRLHLGELEIGTFNDPGRSRNDLAGGQNLFLEKTFNHGAADLEFRSGFLQC
jgi:hypothetical protein